MNSKKILESNLEILNEFKNKIDFETALEKFEKEEDENKIIFENNGDKEDLYSYKKIGPSVEDNKDSEEKDKKLEDDDFLISQSLAKLKIELSGKEKICEDLNGWDEEI